MRPRRLPKAKYVSQPELSDDAPGQQPSPRQRILQGLRIVVVVAVIGAVAYALVTQWAAVRTTISSMNIWTVVGATILLLGGIFATLKIWHSLLSAMGVDVPYRHAAPVNLVGQLGKYLPGSVWAFVIQAQLGRRYGIPRVQSFLALLLSAGVCIVTGASLGPIVAPTLASKWGGWAWLLAAGPILLVALFPSALSRVLSLATRLGRRAPINTTLRPRGVLLAIIWAYVSWVVLGAHLWLLTAAVPGGSDISAFVLFATIAVAMSAGFVAFFLPSGIGVRETIIVAILSTQLSLGQSIGIAFVSRVLFTIADIGGALVGICVARPWKARAMQRQEAPAESD